jgi:HK97 family phage major capsid protein
MSDDMISRLLARQKAAHGELDALKTKRTAITEAMKAELREEMEESEDQEFRALTDQIKAKQVDIEERDERIQQLNDEAEREKRSDVARRRVQQVEASIRVQERRTYERTGRNSYLRDLAASQIQGDMEARQRLINHGQDVMAEPEYQEYRDLTRVDGAGGYFVPPKWLMDQAIELARAGRPTANLFNSQPLPGGTDSISIPRIATGTATAIQPNDNDPVQETDLTDNALTFPVRTIAGQQDIALQLLEQSPINFDELVFRDLIADFNTKLNVQVLNGAGTSGTMTGIFVAAGTTSVVYTDATPTVGELYSKLAGAIQTVQSARFMNPNVWVMHPRRWAWFLAAVDTAGRPLVVPNQQGPTNAIGTQEGVGMQQVVGTLLGIPVVTDPSIPTNFGTNEDRILLMRTDDIVLYESPVRTRVLPEVLSGNLTVRLQVYGYAAFTAGRYPAAYTKQTVAAQKEFAADRKVDKVKFEDLGLRGTEVAEDTAPTAPRSAAAKTDTATKTEAK